jgi:hypothetical protein
MTNVSRSSLSFWFFGPLHVGDGKTMTTLVYRPIHARNGLSRAVGLEVLLLLTYCACERTRI